MNPPFLVRLFELGVSKLPKLRSFSLLGADIQQPDARFGPAQHTFGIKASHECKLQKMFRRALHVSPQSIKTAPSFAVGITGARRPV